MNSQFDELTKSMAQSVTRRAALKKFGVTYRRFSGMTQPVAWRTVSLGFATIIATVSAGLMTVRAEDPPSFAFNFPPYGSVPGGVFFYPDPIAVHSNGTIYVGDVYNRIVRFSPLGTYLGQWGSSGTGAGQFNTPGGIAFDGSNNVYVVDTYNHRVQKFTTTGAYRAQWGGPGATAGRFNSPFGVALDASNNVYVADYGNSRVQKFTSGGAYLAEWPVGYPVGIAVDGSNNLYITGSSTISKFGSDGTYLAQLGQFLSAARIAVDASNNVYVTDYNNRRIQKFRGDGTYVTQWGFDVSGGIAVDPTGNFVYASAGVSVTAFAYNPAGPPIISGQPSPSTQIVPAAENITFNPGVFGGPPLNFQWRFNGTNMPGATNLSLTLSNLDLSNSGNYSFVVTNELGSALSSNALVIVRPGFVATRPAYVTSPTTAVLNGMVTPGAEAAVWFQWGHDTNYGNLAGATIVPSGANVVPLQAGLEGLGREYVYHYRLVSSNNYGIVYGADQQFTMGRRVAAWGADNYADTYGQTAVPPGMSNVVAIACGRYHSLALNNDGTVVGWGFDFYGESSVPPGLSNVVAVACGGSHSLALKSNGSVVAWGDNFGGQVTVPANMTNVVAIGGGYDRSFALKADGTVVAWPFGLSANLSNIVAIAPYHGQSFLGVVNNGTVVGSSGAILDIAGVSNVVAGGWGYILRADGIVVALGGFPSVPAGLSNVVAIANYSDFGGYYLALRMDGTVAAWGGDPSYGVPAGLSNAVGIAAGGFHSLALTPRARPTAVTLPADGVPADGARLNAIISPNDAETVVWFRWGTTTNYGNTTQATNVGSSSGNLGVSCLVTGLVTNSAYHVQALASNILGTASGADISFTLSAPSATSQPQSHTLPMGAAAVFRVAVGGVGPFSYQWMFDVTNTIPGATNSICILPGVQPTNSGRYGCVITAPFGSITSSYALLAVTTSSAYAPTVLADQPLVYYRFDEVSGTFALNSGILGEAGNATYNANVSLGNPSLVPAFAYAAGFNNTNSGVAVPALGNLNQFTIEVWAKPRTFNVSSPGNPHSQYNSIYTSDIWTHGALHTHFVNLTGHAPQWQLAINGNGPNEVYAGNSAVFPTNGWVHLAAAYDSTTRTTITYVNGHAYGTNILTTAIPVNLAAAHIGAWVGAFYSGQPSTPNWFDGEIDEFAIYGTALPASRIQAHYHTAIGYPALLAARGTNSLILSWIGPGFRLERKGDLADVSGWAPVAGGSNSPVSVTLTNFGNQFFRLRWP